jgi:hypothetical protein
MKSNPMISGLDWTGIFVMGIEDKRHVAKTCVIDTLYRDADLPP